jgi:hypothetical protein
VIRLQPIGALCTDVSERPFDLRAIGLSSEAKVLQGHWNAVSWNVVLADAGLRGLSDAVAAMSGFASKEQVNCTEPSLRLQLNESEYFIIVCAASDNLATASPNNPALSVEADSEPGALGADIVTGPGRASAERVFSRRFHDKLPS